MSSLVYHQTVTSGLQAVVRLARSSPVVAVITAPIQKAENVSTRQAQRYPTITATHTTRTALRAANIPAPQLVIMPPDQDTVTMFLLSNLPPENSREDWRQTISKTHPLTWRNYALTSTEKGGVTWRLSEEARTRYRTRIARLITGRGGRPAPGERPHFLPDDTAREQVLKLAEHLTHYPGFSGVRADVFQLAQYSTRVWKSTRPQGNYPVWPRMPYSPLTAARTAPISDLTTAPQEAHEHASETEEDAENYPE